VLFHENQEVGAQTMVVTELLMPILLRVPFGEHFDVQGCAPELPQNQTSSLYVHLEEVGVSTSKDI